MKQYRILLACVSGMSTSLLMRNMREAAFEHDACIEIFFTSELDILETAQSMDIVMLGPQLRTSRKKFANRLADYHIPVVAISMSDFGDMNGDKVLHYAIEIIEKERKLHHGNHEVSQGGG